MSLTLTEARTRAASISGVAYDVHLDLTDSASSPTFGSRTTIAFTSTAPTTFLELTGATQLEVLVDGVRVEPAYDGRRLHLRDITGSHRVVVDARLPYVTDGDGMHRMVDPADGETYVGAYLGMDIAQKVVCCFDQNDLKAPITVSVSADSRHTVLANGAVTQHVGGQWKFATTPPIPPALLVVAVGPFVSQRWTYAGKPFGWHARASLATALERDIVELRRITEQCFDHYASMFTEPYPFDSFDQVFVPGLNWGAQEMPGCVTYRDEMLPAGSIADHDRLHRAMVIAHEMSHMWFGDLATMTWWEDTWLQESFADYMGFRVAADAAGFTGAQAAFECFDKPHAFDADDRRSTHPVAPRPEDIPDVDAAATIFDAISYAKGNAVIRQLVTWLGDETFLAGVNAYLSAYRFANATLDDFVACLDAVTDRDVRGWVEVWLRRSGHDTIVVTRGDDVPVLRRRGTRAHRFTVVAYDTELREVGRRMVDLGDDPVVLLEFRGRVVVPNALGETFARVDLDDVSASYVYDGLSRLEPLVRAVQWAEVFRADHDTILRAVRDHLPLESEPSIASAVVRRVQRQVLAHRVPAAQAGDALQVLAAASGEALAATADPGLAAAVLPGWILGTRAVGSLHRALTAGTVGIAELTPSDRWALIVRLARLGELDEAGIEAERAASPGLDADLGTLTALAARPTAAAKEEAWSALSADDVDNRRFEALTAGLWSPEHADLCAPYVERYLREAPGWAERGQAFAQTVGRAHPTFRPAPVHIDLLRAQVAGDLPVVLRRHWEDWLDDLTG